MLKVLDLFSGIGGFSLGLERTGGFETVAFCEIDPFCQKVLHKHWPGIPVYSDVRWLRGYMFPVVDVITGGFPCQDISVAGKRGGIEAERSGLWSHLCRLISEIRPRFAIVENVANLLSGPSEQRGGWFGKVLGDLAEVGYDAEWDCIPAGAIGATHYRDRVWITAYPSGQRLARRIETPSALRRQASLVGTNPWDDLPECIGYASRNGFPEYVGCIRGLGNAVVPQIPELIGNAILEAEAAN